MKSFREFIEEDAVAANAVGGGHIAGVGIGPQGEPGVPPKKKKKVVLAMVARGKPNNV